MKKIAPNFTFIQAVFLYWAGKKSNAIVAFIFLAVVLPSILNAQHNPIKLYAADSIPNSKMPPKGYEEKTIEGRIYMVTEPEIIPYFPAKGKANGSAVIICPGGGYSRLAMPNEGYEIAEKFNEIGVTAFILKYRLPSDKIMQDRSIGPLQDAQRAMQIIRRRANEWLLNRNKVGIIGFSAGGHVASWAGTHFDKAVIENKDSTSLRPDFMMLIYAVIIEDAASRRGSFKNLLGADTTQAQLDKISNEKYVTANTPPTFMVHAEDDAAVPIQGSIAFYLALLANKVKAEMHLYPSGKHGFGLNNKTTRDYWFNSAANWLQAIGFLEK